MSYQPYVTTLPLMHQGKVRDTHRTAIPGTLLMVATDRLSTHNVVHESTIPDKGYILTALTVFWIQEVLKDTPHHVLAYGNAVHNYLPRGLEYPDDLHLRSIVVRKLTMCPVELIFRARMAGSLWKDSYSKNLQNPYGLDLPVGLELMSPFDSPIFTPTEKSDTDDPVNTALIEKQYPEEVVLARQVYSFGRDYALSCGIDPVDTKCEVGSDRHGTPRLADEFLTGDSSRFVYTSDIVVGQEPPWADKQIFREVAEKVWAGGKKHPLVFPDSVIEQGRVAYHRVLETLTHLPLSNFQRTYLS